ncbi:MAG: ABC transporter transmembrane domain-containing protein [Pseudomonadota bacterium]
MTLHDSVDDLKPRIGFTILAATLALNLLAVALPLVVLQIFDRVIPFQATETLFFLFMGMCVVAALEFSLKWARIVLLSNVGEAYERDLSHRFMRATLDAEPDAFAKTTSAAHLDHFGAISQLRGFYSGQGRILAIDLPFAAIFITMIGFIGGWLVLVPLASVTVLLLFKVALKRVQSTIFEKRKTLDDRRYSFLVEVLSQIKTLKANTMEPQIQRRYELLQDQTSNISQRVIQFAGFSQSFGALFSQMAVAAMGLFGGFLIITGHIGIAELAACMLLNGRTVQPMLRALNLWVQTENLATSRAKLDDTFRIPARPVFAQKPLEITGRITFDNLGMKHPARDAFLFRNLNMDVAPTENLAVFGQGGAGKSTLMKLILGEVEPSEGRILIDGVPARDLVEMRGVGCIGYADQRPVVFAGTVLENISAFGDGETIDRALELSERLGLEKVLHRLPMGYNTLMQDSAALANNQTALLGISLVRTMALRPKILLLNNVTATMETGARQGFLSLIREVQASTTLIISSSDQKLLQVAERHLDLSAGTSIGIDEWIEDAHADAADQARSAHFPGERRSA